MKPKTQVAKAPAHIAKQDAPWIVAIVEACILVVVVLYAGFVIYDLMNQLRTARLGNGTAYVCERDLKACQQQAAESSRNQEEMLPLRYVLDNDVLLVREAKGDGPKQDFWLVKEPTDDSSEGIKKFIGSFEVAEGPGTMQAFSLKKRSDGLYTFTATADYVEAGSETVGYIDPKTLNFVTFSNVSERQNDLRLSSQDVSEAFITPHLSQENCATSSSAVIDRLDWNSEILYAFRSPPKVKCFVNELAGGIGVSALPTDITKLSVARNQQSFVLPLQNGQGL